MESKVDSQRHPDAALTYASVCDDQRQLSWPSRTLLSVSVAWAKDTVLIESGKKWLTIDHHCVAAPRCAEALVSRLRGLAASGARLERVTLEVRFDDANADASERYTIAIIDLVQPAELKLYVRGTIMDARLGRILSHQKGSMTLYLSCVLGATGAFLELAQPAPRLKVLEAAACLEVICKRECWESPVGSDFRGLSRYPELCAVRLDNARHLTDESAIALAGARGLREIWVTASPRLTSKGIGALAAHRGLRQLRIDIAHLDDDICPILATNDTIVDLTLTHSLGPHHITQRCLPHLAKMKSLRFRNVPTFRSAP